MARVAVQLRQAGNWASCPGGFHDSLHLIALSVKYGVDVPALLTWWSGRSLRCDAVMPAMVSVDPGSITGDLIRAK